MRVFRFLLLTIALFLTSPFILGQTQSMMWGLTSSGGNYGLGAIYKANINGSGLEVKHSFTGVKGSNPLHVKLLPMSDGGLYGMTLAGGKFMKGVLFRFFPANGTYEALIDFDGPTTGSYPYGSLIVGLNGKLYGVASEGGLHNKGVFFEFDPTTKSFTKRHDFDGPSGAMPYGTPVVGPSGLIYGVTNLGGANNVGAIYEYDMATQLLSKKKDMASATGAKVIGSMTFHASGYMLGMASEGGTHNLGTLFQYTPASNTLVKRVDFTGPNGKNPSASLTQGPGTLVYGLTPTGGSFDNGTLFEYNPTTFELNTRLDFDGTSKGGLPYSGLLLASNGKFYGSTEQGLNGYGGLFEYDLTTGNLISFVSFFGSATGIGYSLRGTMVQVGSGKVYGVTRDGGFASRGTIFELDLTTKGTVAKVNFAASDAGDFPTSSVVQHPNGKLYGVTFQGGPNKAGVLFEYDISQGLFTKKVDFDYINQGTSTSNPLVVATNSLLYGTTPVGGTNGNGVLYSYDPSNNTLVKLYDFTSSFAGSPAGIIQASNGKLYGGTLTGGANNHGAIFEYSIDTKQLAVRASLDEATSGNFITSPLVEVGSKLYGVSRLGGSSNKGTLIEFDPISGILTTKITFTGANGAWPIGPLVLAPNGNLFGVTELGGANDRGSIFEYNVATHTLTVRYSFTGNNEDGVGQDTGMSLSPNGLLYGLTRLGGLYNLGTLYEFDPLTYIYTKKIDFSGANGALPTGATPIFVTMQPQTIAFDPIPTIKYGDPSFVLTATSSSGLPLTFQSSNATVATVNGNTVTIVGAGSAVLTARQSGTASYFSASADQPLLVDKLAQTVTLEAIPNKSRFDPPFTVIATNSSGLALTLSSSDPTVATLSGSTVTIVGAGTSTITASHPGNQNYLPGSASRPLLVNKAAQTISLDLPVTSPVQSFLAPFTVTAAASSGLPVTISSSNSAVASVSGTTVTLGIPGSATLTATQSGNADYEPASTDQELVVTPVTGMEPDAGDRLRAYPNPADQLLYLSLPSSDLPDNHTAEMVDVLGKRKPVTLRRVEASTYVTPVDDLVAGVYLIDLQVPGIKPLKVLIAR